MQENNKLFARFWIVQKAIGDALLDLVKIQADEKNPSFVLLKPKRDSPSPVDRPGQFRKG